MASVKSMFFFLFVAFFLVFLVVASAEERVKKQVLINPYAGVYPQAAYPYGYGHYPYALSYADDGSYFPGKYDPFY